MIFVLLSTITRIFNHLVACFKNNYSFQRAKQFAIRIFGVFLNAPYLPFKNETPLKKHQAGLLISVTHEISGLLENHSHDF